MGAVGATGASVGGANGLVTSMGVDVGDDDGDSVGGSREIWTKSSHTFPLFPPTIF